MELNTLYGLDHFTDLEGLEKLKTNFVKNNTDCWNEKLIDGSFYEIYCCGYSDSIGICQTFEEKIKKLKNSPCNGVYLMHFVKPKNNHQPFQSHDSHLEGYVRNDIIALHQYY